MCGISGYSLAQECLGTPQLALEQSMKAISHRGPDDSGLYFDLNRKIGLSHTRLSIQDVSAAGHQPMLNEDKDVIIILNGEIYNFLEIKSKLNKCKKINWNGNSDTEVVLQLYLTIRNDKTKIIDFLKNLNGMYSIAIWDKKYETLFLARDPLGIKPLYYSSLLNGICFASEIKSLQYLISFIDPERSNFNNSAFDQLDYKAIDRYISFHWCPGKRTPFNYIKKVSPGEFLTVKSGKIISKNKWYLLPSPDNFNKYNRQSKLVSDTQLFLRKAVHRQMISDVPVGAFLSGGLDSSSVVAFAKEINPDIKCFTFANNYSSREGFVDDLPYAKKVAEHLNVSLEILQINPFDFDSDFKSMIIDLEEPLADLAPMNVFLISKLARECGVKVLLSGAGGDDIFTGYRRHFALNTESFWSWLPQPSRQVIQNLSQLLPSEKPFFRRVGKVFSGAGLNDNDRLINYFKWINRKDLNSLYSYDFLQALGQAKAELPMEEFLLNYEKDLSPLSKMLLLEQRFFLTDHNLLYTDKMSMAAGVEVRVPLLDHELINFASTIPLNCKQRGSIGKWIFKKSMEPFLPLNVIYREKTGFGAPFRDLLRNELSGWLMDTLSEETVKKRGLFDPKAVTQLIDFNAKGKLDATYTLLSLACIELWCECFLDKSVQKLKP